MTTITVLPEHIFEGVRSSCTHCPIALAFVDAFPFARSVWVAGSRVEIEDDDGDVTDVDLPGEVEEFIGRFDDDGFGESFTFTVDYPEATS